MSRENSIFILVASMSDREARENAEGRISASLPPVKVAEATWPGASSEAERVRAAPEPGTDTGEITLPLIAYPTGAALMPLVRAPHGRPWMDATNRRYAYRCLPMVIANQAGWFILSSHKIAATWDGGVGLASLQVECLEGGGPPFPAVSHFGSGILTWTLPYLFRTTPGYNLLCRGPANMPKDGIAPLEGIIETDWADSTFTMNWKMTRAHHRVVFEVGEPIAMIVPQPRGELEIFRPEIRHLSTDSELETAYAAWRRSRQQFKEDLTRPGSEAQKRGWQKHYMRGETVTQRRAPEHQRRLVLSDFVDRREQTKLHSE